ncbi:succinyl-CoA-L-malate CoA-transferase beta subunit [Candidatus Phycosocius bacilliformis]|uniref:Succinyl-CoA-L-malate CoA-transferase beta subunit n=1 Tax=Candidatus Phycosocius bacilliformis TaxID=1445552 RepID=A0A2P2EA86_9PROT|nr:CaiB/BaiF CoA-transferase family protein [Candidatus Phycosocius bacilliformis]GBF57987.1 succinyl-CoA-L-malate CoA-transferase beta subunit [Candidatus Phycosocius bacilliformis]
MTEATGPLQGLRVIELGVLLAGPFCGQILGDLGAEVIKVEPPGQGDPLRQWGTVKKDGHGLWFPIVGRNKTCVTIDLRQAEGQAIVKDLVREADFLLENFRPGTLEKWGLDYETLAAINPRLIMIRVSGYGQTGPNSPKAGYASVGEAMGGMRYVMGEPDRMPSRAGISIGDSLAATYAAIGALAALEHRHRTGKGQIVDSAIYEACFAMMESLIPDYHFGGYIRERTGSFLPKIAPSNIYPASDGMVIIAANQDTVWRRLAEAMGRAELADDPRFLTHVARGEHQGELDGLISAWSSQMTIAELEACCEDHGVPCGRIYRAPDMLADPHFAARQAIVEVDHPQLGPFPMPAVFPKLSATPGNVRWTGPELGSHTEAVLRDLLGYSPDKIAHLRTSGVI